MSSRQVIGLVGYATAGKDTAADALCARGWQRVSVSDPVCDVLLAIDPFVSVEWSFSNGYSGLSHNVYVRFSEYLHGGCNGDWATAKRHPEVRRLLQVIGTEAGRDIHGQDCWVDIARRKIESFDGPSVVVNVRFQNEADMVLQHFCGRLIHITRPGVSAVNGHVSDALIDHLANLAFATLSNNGSEKELHAKILDAVGIVS